MTYGDWEIQSGNQLTSRFGEDRACIGHCSIGRLDLGFRNTDVNLQALFVHFLG